VTPSVTRMVRIPKQSGHLFQDRYRAILCDRDSYLMELIRYLSVIMENSRLCAPGGH